VLNLDAGDNDLALQHIHPFGRHQGLHLLPGEEDIHAALGIGQEDRIARLHAILAAFLGALAPTREVAEGTAHDTGNRHVLTLRGCALRPASRGQQ